MTQKIILWSSRKLYTFKGFIVNTFLSMFISIAFTLDMRYDVMAGAVTYRSNRLQNHTAYVPGIHLFIFGNM